MNIKYWLYASVGAFIFIFALEWLVHGVWLMPAYEQTSHLWRTPGEIPMWYMFVCQFLFSAVFAYIFTLNYEGKGWKEGLRFGLYIGGLLAVIDLAKYGYMPLSFGLITAWMGASLLKGIGSGIALSLIYKK